MPENLTCSVIPEFPLYETSYCTELDEQVLKCYYVQHHPPILSPKKLNLGASKNEVMAEAAFELCDFWGSDIMVIYHELYLQVRRKRAFF